MFLNIIKQHKSMSKKTKNILNRYFFIFFALTIFCIFTLYPIQAYPKGKTYKKWDIGTPIKITAPDKITVKPNESFSVDVEVDDLDHYVVYEMDEEDLSRMPKEIDEGTEEDWYRLWATFGDKTSGSLSFTAPSKPGEYIINIKVDDDGIVRSGNKGSRDDGEKTAEVKILVVKVEFIKDEKKIDWEEEGAFNAKALLTDDSDKENVIWTISSTPSATIDNDGEVTFSSDNIYETESEGTYTIIATHQELATCKDNLTLKVVAYLKVPVILKRKHISLKSDDDKYGHWWVEVNGNKSYGWWPDRYVNIKDTLISVPGILNGQDPAPFRGTPTRDPHHGYSADESIQTYIKSHERTIAEVKQNIRNFANNYSGTWRWPFGQNCQSFQKSMVSSVKLIKEDEVK